MTATTTIEIVLHTALGTNASEIGDAYGSYEGCRWGHAVNGCYNDGCGRVSVWVPADSVEFIAAELETDDRVTSYAI